MRVSRCWKDRVRSEVVRRNYIGGNFCRVDGKGSVGKVSMGFGDVVGGGGEMWKMKIVVYVLMLCG